MTFLNLWGFLGLLGIPVVVYIHMLHRQSQKIPISTLFLLDVTNPEKQSGKRFDRLRNSLLLWLNLLAVLLLTCLLVQPRNIQSRKILKAVIVVDASSSMQPFIKDASDTLFNDLKLLNEEASGMELTIISSILEEQTIYNGGDLVEAEKRLSMYVPSHTGHDFEPALRRAQSIFGSESILIFLSDRKQETPEGFVQILSGRKLNNVGFAGFSANDQGKWRATVRNYGQAKVSLEYWLGTRDKTNLLTRSLTLDAGSMKTIAGEFFEGNDTLVLQLTDDEFKIDNQICAVKPLKKALTVNLQKLSLPSNAFFHSLLNRIPRVKLAENQGDFFLGATAEAIPADKPGIFWPATNKETRTIQGGVIAMIDELMEGLVWEGVKLPIISTHHFENITGSRPLLVFEDEILMAVRETGKGPQLLIRLDLNSVELQQSPAMLILIYRCLEKVRLHKKAYNQQNMECNNILIDPSLKGTKVVAYGAQNLGLGRIAMNSSPGFFTLKEKHLDDSQTLLLGATHFADAGEADFMDAVSENYLKKEDIQMIEVYRENDFLKPLWLILLLIICLYGWVALDKKQKLTKQRLVSV